MTKQELETIAQEYQCTLEEQRDSYIIAGREHITTLYTVLKDGKRLVTFDEVILMEGLLRSSARNIIQKTLVKLESKQAKP